MIAARCGMLFVAAWLALVAAGANAADVPPPVLRVMVAAVLGLLAPLFWPGVGATPARTVLRVAAWSAAAACLAGVLLRGFGHAAQPLMPDVAVCGMLWLILVVALMAAARLEAWFGGAAPGQGGAHALAGVAVAFVLALLGALPLWLGPGAELLATRQPNGAIDIVLGLSPLSHLSVAAANDLLRNDWFYRHSSLAGLQFSYPGLATTAWALAAAGLGWILFTLARRPPGRSADSAHHIEHTTEKAR
jgi:hypothetical protein